MARVTIEDCIAYYPNRFEIVVLAAHRARQLQAGMPSVLEDEGHKPAVQALKELGEGYVSWENVYELDEQERLQAQAANHLA